ncbi:hypothetical protein DOTSEDRAFT_70407 [Dothistroma septosporum NZE10]|uniref:Carboxylic ester hydrolase n=1 Tax=Dothistroma septosporum (strain NZE10 / CBS 128990) TaxID=675120 RepID=N1PSN5_DOTSN|nr:hypothetical protein DOTSEDRAFT_70407 [Dothistroma septosporum NZE10]
MKASSLMALAFAGCAIGSPTATTCHGVTYNGIYRDQTEIFLGLRYGEDTSGENRFKPPRPHIPAAGTVVQANDAGPACPQTTGANNRPLLLGNITSISEDCLRLNVARPNGTTASSNLPVMVWIHGGGFIGGSKDDPATQPGGLILESVANGHPVIHVSINYRLGVFGFAQSNALKAGGSENAGLRDQRLALEWVQQNIADFGGDPRNVTIHGQSSGGLAVGMQILAYGGEQPASFQRAICQSQALEAGITGNYTRDAMHRVIANNTKCADTDQQSAVTIQCLRGLDMEELLQAQSNVHLSDYSHNIGDEWLPVVDGDFLPSAPSELIHTGRFNNISVAMGWCEDDAAVFLDPAPSNATAVHDAFRAFLPGFSQSNLDRLLALYPVADFITQRFTNGTVKKDAQFYRAARILRDIVLTCQPLFYGRALAKAGNDVYYYVQNQTILRPILEEGGGFAYMFGNISHYNAYGYKIEPTAADYALKDGETRSWSSFAAVGYPSLEGKDTLQGWETAKFEDEDLGIYVIGGPNGGYSGSDGSGNARAAVQVEKLQERCAFLNSPDAIKQLGY